MRDAVTLERLEYCILKDEDGNKRYVHGPKVVFPEPTETFVTSPKGGYIFKAIELSKISGIYIKVIAEYTENKVTHPVGEELFITGNDQMIYYPRPEHAIISYDGKLVHHAIAIPAGEGRYIMNRLTGEIKTVKGPSMYLPDPRVEVVVKRKLTDKQCSLWFPGNHEALEYNRNLTERAVEKLSKSLTADAFSWATQSYNSSADTLAYLESNANISRGTSYTKPRTITLDNKYDGVVSMDIWTGYAVNVISKTGERKVVCGPQTILLDYDQTLEEVITSTGKPKTTDKLDHTVFLRHENNKISDVITAETSDFVEVKIKVSYCVDFDKEYQNKWFNVENYIKYLCDRLRSLIKREVKNYTIEDFYQNYSDIIRKISINASDDNSEVSDSNRVGRFFPENGMCIKDAEVLALDIQSDIADLLTEHQYDMVQKTLELTNAEKRIHVAEQLSLAEQKEFELQSEKYQHKMKLERAEALNKLEIQSEINRKQEAERIAANQAKKDMQQILKLISVEELARDAKINEAKNAQARVKAEIEKAKQDAYAATIQTIMSSISPELVAALTTKSNNDMLETVTAAMAPYAIAKGESIPDTVNLLLRGTSLENVIKDVNLNV